MPDREPAPLNRARLAEALAAVLADAERERRSGALFMVSVNGLGPVNARFGLDVGDELIASVGRVLAATLAGSGTVGRYGPNTFAVVVADCDAARLAATAEPMLAAVRNARLETSAGALAATISVGGTALPRERESAADAIAAALGALERAKQRQSGKGAFVAHDPAKAARRAKAGGGALLGALEEDRLLLLLQPVVDASTREPAFYEGLLRIRDPDGTLIPAAVFVEEAEALGLVRRIDRRALELGIALLAAHPALTLAINISSLTAGDEDWTAALERLAAGRTDIYPRLIVEVTETAMIRDFEAAAAFLARLRTLGCRIALDDFGAGHTSFRHLRSLDIDLLKIDASLIAGLPDDARGRALVTSILDMAAALGLETVAECVADEAAARFLEAAGTTYLQGFLLGPPLSVEALREKGLL